MMYSCQCYTVDISTDLNREKLNYKNNNKLVIE